MVTGMRGPLLSEAFLEAEPRFSAGAPHDRLALEWRRRAGALGPAVSLNAMLVAGAAPLAEMLGFAAPSSIRTTEQTIAATLDASGDTVALVVVSWGVALDSCWRAAIAEAGRRGTSYALVFNGVRLRLFDARTALAPRWTEST